jgi:hypothetical protein
LPLVTINQWRRQRDRAAAWAALCFGTLGLVVVLGRADRPRASERLPSRTSCSGSTFAFLLLFRTSCTGSRPSSGARPRGLESALGLMTVAMIVWTVRPAAFPEPGSLGPACSSRISSAS